MCRCTSYILTPVQCLIWSNHFSWHKASPFPSVKSPKKTWTNLRWPRSVFICPPLIHVSFPTTSLTICLSSINFWFLKLFFITVSDIGVMWVEESLSFSTPLTPIVPPLGSNILLSLFRVLSTATESGFYLRQALSKLLHATQLSVSP